MSDKLEQVKKRIAKEHEEYRISFNDIDFRNNIVENSIKSKEFLTEIYQEEHIHGRRSQKEEKAYCIYGDLIKEKSISDLLLVNEFEQEADGKKILFKLYTNDFDCYIKFRVTDNSNKMSLKN